MAASGECADDEGRVKFWAAVFGIIFCGLVLTWTVSVTVILVKLAVGL